MPGSLYSDGGVSYGPGTFASGGGGGPPSGPAGGDLTGTYPNPNIAAGVIVDADVNATAAIASSKLADGANIPSSGEKAALPGTSGTPGAGNKYVTDADPRNSNSRTPSGAAGGSLAGTYPNPTLLPPVGSPVSPSIPFATDPTTGLYRPSPGVIGVASGGVQVGVWGPNGTQVADGAVGSPAYSFLTDSSLGMYNAGGAIGFALGGAQIGSWDSNAMRTPNGFPVRPAHSFLTDITTGMYLFAPSRLGFAAAGTPIARMDSAGLTVNVGGVYGPDGSASAPTFSFTTTPGTGMYLYSASGRLGLASNGALIGRFDAAGITAEAGAFNALDGSASTPTFSFTSNTDLGMFRSGANELGFAAGGINNLRLGTNTMGFYGNAPISKPIVTGSRAGNLALTNLLAALSLQGLIANLTTP